MQWQTEGPSAAPTPTTVQIPGPLYGQPVTTAQVWILEAEHHAIVGHLQSEVDVLIDQVDDLKRQLRTTPRRRRRRLAPVVAITQFNDVSRILRDALDTHPDHHPAF